MFGVAQWLMGCSTASTVDSGRRGLLDVEGPSRSGGWVSKLTREGRDQARVAQGGTAREALKAEDEDSDLSGDRPGLASASGFSWPLAHVSITSDFGRRKGGELHEGLDLRAASGTPVFAAHTGRVMYAGNKIRGYGWLVVIKDTHGYSSIYAHNSKLLVMQGQSVTRGQKIALSGATGAARGPHVHFEIRKGVEAKNPHLFLSEPPSARVAQQAPIVRPGRPRGGRALARAR